MSQAVLGLTLSIVGAFWAGCASTQPTAVDANTVYSPALKVTITKPATWQFISAADVRQAQKATHSTNATLNYLVYQYGTVPFVTIGREQTIVSDIAPLFMIYREPLNEDRLAPSEKVLGFEMWAFLNVMTGARVVGPTIHVKVGGDDYAYNRIRYPIKSRTGQTFEIERRFWVRASAISAIVMTASFDLRDAAQAEPEIEQIVRSITPATTPPQS